MQRFAVVVEPDESDMLSAQSMGVQVGHIEALFRYPVKSMAGERLESAMLGWHGIEGDRRLALRRREDRSAFPWLTASKLPELVLFTPVSRDGDSPDDLPTHVRTPNGTEMTLFGEELADDIGRRYGSGVEMMHMRHGIFDDASISVIASDTVREITQLAGVGPDVRRFRPNVFVRLLRPAPFQEDEWVGGELSFGEGDDAPAITVALPDVRCAVVNVDPDTGALVPDVLKTAVRANGNNAGVYCVVTRVGRLEAGQPIFLNTR